MKNKRWLLWFNPNYRDIYEAIAIGLFGIFWIFVVISTLNRIEAYNPQLIFQVCAVLVGSLGICVAISKMISDQLWRESEVYLEQSLDLLSKSFAALKFDSGTEYPINSRSNWLTSSRLLLAACSLGSKITRDSHRKTYEEYIEFWRAEYRGLLKFDVDGGPEPEYFYQEGELHAWSSRTRAPIAERSIAVLYRFVQWPDRIEDHLDTEADFSEDEILNLYKRGSKNIAIYVERSRGKNS